MPQLAEDHSGKGQAVADITARKPPGLGGDAVHPFQARAAHPERRRCFSPAIKSIVAPTHNATFARIACRCRWTQSSCFGAPKPTINTSGRAAATPARMRSFSASLRSNPVGGLSRPTTFTPGHRCSVIRAARSLTSGRAPRRNARIGRSARPRSKSLGTKSLPATRSGTAPEQPRQQHERRAVGQNEVGVRVGPRKLVVALEQNGVVDVGRHHVTTPIKIGSADPSAKFVDRLVQAARMQVNPKEINRPWNSHRGLVSPPARCFQSISQPAKLGKPSDPVEKLQGDVTGRWAFGVRSRVGRLRRSRVRAIGGGRTGSCGRAVQIVVSERVDRCRKSRRPFLTGRANESGNTSIRLGSFCVISAVTSEREQRGASDDRFGPAGTSSGFVYGAP